MKDEDILYYCQKQFIAVEDQWGVIVHAYVDGVGQPSIKAGAKHYFCREAIRNAADEIDARLMAAGEAAIPDWQLQRFGDPGILEGWRA